MEIRSEQKDALTELINIGFGRAASSLSNLLNQKIDLATPIVEIHQIDNPSNRFGDQSNNSKDVIVHQTFEGKFHGDVLLVMDIESSTILIDLLSGGEGVPHRMTISDREAMAEVGNIMLNAYIGSFSNLLNYQVKFSMVKLFEESIEVVINRISKSNTFLQYILLVTTEIRAMKGAVNGKVALIIGEDSLKLLTEDILDYLD
ncbi:MAG: chemotaxis protein CheC [Anaerolineaceae bacterium]|nr:chemotaxis protein CheC [Anaerolineaceae bacterium]